MNIYMVNYIYIFVVCLVALKVKMSDVRGCTPVTLVRTNGALNDSQKPRGLCKPYLQMARRKPGAPVSGAAIGKRGQRLKWATPAEEWFYARLYGVDISW